MTSYPEEKTYDLGLNVNSLDKLSFTSPTEARIEGSEDFTIGADGAPADTVKVTRLK